MGDERRCCSSGFLNRCYERISRKNVFRGRGSGGGIQLVCVFGCDGSYGLARPVACIIIPVCAGSASRPCLRHLVSVIPPEGGRPVISEIAVVVIDEDYSIFYFPWSGP